ncbi:MAG: hypothetical protein KGD60_12605, partial [Candidatus Thorarchaeota archaeon]|nr:hypothetical protein [Candidatus Thorarchaeota archaeon]
MALTMKDDHEVVFIGGREIRGQHLSVFSETSVVPLGNGAQIVYDWRVKNRWLKAIDDVRPDVIHAHNVIVGHFLIDTEYPVVFDDHENLSRQKFVFMSRTFLRRNFARIIVRKLPEWEREMAKRYPVLTISEGATRMYEPYTTRIGVVHNMPWLQEIEWLESPPDRKGLVYMGNDFVQGRFSPMRDMTGLDNLLKFDIVTGLNHRDMMMALAKHKIGLLPYLPHPFQLICNPNKGYEYLHAGLQVVVNTNYQGMFHNNPYMHFFNDYDDIVEVVEAIEDIDAEAIMNYARENYIWDKFVNVIKEAYRQA